MFIKACSKLGSGITVCCENKVSTQKILNAIITIVFIIDRFKMFGNVLGAGFP
jgi:hypothetical protein